MKDRIERTSSALHTTLVVGFMVGVFVLFRAHAAEVLDFVEVLGGQPTWWSGILAAAHRSLVPAAILFLVAIALVAKEFLRSAALRMSINAWVVVILAWLSLATAVALYAPLRKTLLILYNGVIDGSWPPR